MKFFAVLATVLFALSSATDVKDHLRRFGFLNPFQFDSASVGDALKKYQRTFNLPETGVADETTIALMSTPRCGRPDNDANNLFADKAWYKKALSFYFNNYTPDMSQSRVRDLTRRAFKFWSDVTPLTFQERNRGDIVISFGSGRHHDGRQQCGYPFDGASGTLAHAFFPPDGRLHFDEAERYTEGTSSGTNYLWVATHELGHILGLEHDTQNRNAVMYPYYRGYSANMQLHSNDIRRIQRLYGKGGSGGNGGGSGGSGGGSGSGDCRDTDSQCQQNIRGCKDWGQDWIDYMKQACKKTCGFCSGGGGGGGGGGGDCKDTVTDCQKHIKGCREWGDAWKQYMQKHCRQSCRFC